MATKTMGTAATTTLTAVAFNQDPSILSAADLATMVQAILDDQAAAQLSGVGGFVREGLLIVPNRGALKLYNGDFVAIDPATGFPILISALAAAGANWVHT